jgi:ubiquinone/menaquinone biosynthesis C-methylase UbiE
MNERRFHGNVERLRSPERLALLETERVVDACLAGVNIQTLLDAGVGSGVFAEVFIARGLDVTGVDVNPEMIDVAQRFVPTGHFQIAAVEDLPYSDNSFDLVFFGHILHETDHALQAMVEARRVARVGVAILEWPYLQEQVGPPLAHRMKPEEILTLAQQAGFGTCEEVSLAHMVLYRLMKNS